VNRRAGALALAGIAVGVAGCLPPPPPVSSRAPSTHTRPVTPPTYRIIVQDHTGAAWPVHEAAARWGGLIGVGTCRTGIRCVQVYEVSNLGNRIVGCTSDCNHIGGNLVRLSDRYAGIPYSQRLQAIEHELGHIMFLVHTCKGCGVMEPVVTGRFTSPTSIELATARKYMG
jgi:hypothetical protein